MPKTRSDVLRWSTECDRLLSESGELLASRSLGGGWHVYHADLAIGDIAALMAWCRDQLVHEFPLYDFARRSQD